MKCSNCGTQNAPGRKCCEVCGLYLQSEFAHMRPASKPESHKSLLVAIVVIVVAFVVIVPALLYFMVLGFSSAPPGTPSATLDKESISGGALLTLVAITRQDILWEDVQIQISDGLNTVGWSPHAPECVLDSGTSKYVGEHIVLGAVEVWLDITDYAAVSYLGVGDYFTIARASAYQWDTTSMYTVNLMYEPTRERACSVSFHF